MFDILVAGEINPDLILSGNVIPDFGQVEKLVDAATLSVGSSSAIFACGAARLGLKVGFIGLCGDDIFGHFMLDEMRKHNIDVSNVIVRADGQTGLSVILSQGPDRAILTHPGLIPFLKAEDITDSLFRQTRHLHIASCFLQTSLQAGLPRLFERAHQFGITTSLDTNWDPQERWDSVREILPLVDVFLPNAAEACAIADMKNVRDAAIHLAEKTKIVAVKLGADGALGAQNHQLIQKSSLKVKVIDTVGAGDSFDAGFLYGYLKGWELEKALRMGVVCGSLSTRSCGGTESQPTLEEALSHAKLSG